MARFFEYCLSNSSPREFCALFGICGGPARQDAAEEAYLGLYALQHRGQESAGIAAGDGKIVTLHKGMGLVRTVFADPGTMAELRGNVAIGHTRYSTTGASGIVNAQPVLIQFKKGQLAAAHNGNLVNAAELRARLEDSGSIFQTTSDSEVVLHLIARSRKATLPEMIADALLQVQGAYCFLFLAPGQLIAARDPHGFRPLCIGRNRDALVVASESCALDIIKAEYVRSVEPGEMVVMTATPAGPPKVETVRLPSAPRRAFCIFEFVYFARPDSRIFEEKVDKIRRSFGRQLAREHPCHADIVIAVPDSANTAALGYAEESGIKFEMGLIRNHYVGRTFIRPDQHERDLDVRVKFNPVAGVLKGKRVVVIEDSIVRGTTLMQLVKLVRTAGPAEVHVRVSSPQIRFPCYYGIDMSRSEELIGASHPVEEVRRFVGADSLGHLSIEGMLKCVAEPGNYCTCCFSGDYPTPIPNGFDKEQFEIGRSQAQCESCGSEGKP